MRSLNYFILLFICSITFGQKIEKPILRDRGDSSKFIHQLVILSLHLL